MSESVNDRWDAHFYNRSPLFLPLTRVAEQFGGCADWPSLDYFQAIFRASDLPILPVAQGDKPVCFEQHYEPRIYLKGELQTRLHNWHDFFNALIWLRFPRTKAALNELHYFSSLQRDEKTNRSKLENAITLFDECGAVVISRDEELLQMIGDHEWKKLFVDQRSRFEKDITCIVFGHAMYEKALQPYIGMTANVLLIHSEELLNGDVDDIDAYLADYWKQGKITSTKDLRPLPLLGVPGWYVDNDNPLFYDNADYFRPRR